MKAKILFFFLLLTYSQSIAQFSAKISGSVLDSKSKPINGAFVKVENSYHFTKVNPIDGSFELKLSKDAQKIIAWADGYESQLISLKKSQSEYLFKLKKAKQTTLVEKKADSKKKEYKSREGLGRVLSLSAGIHESGEGFSTRGGRDASHEMVGTVTSALEVRVDGAPDVPPGIDSKSALIVNRNDNARSGLLTAGEVNDFSKWNLWNDLSEGDLSNYKEIWKLFPYQRFTLLVQNELFQPVYNVNVNLLENGYAVWSSRTDNTGKAELWASPLTNRPVDNKKLSLEIEYQGSYFYIDAPKSFDKGLNHFTINTGCLEANKVDIAFLVDATGSMGDEINYLKLDIQDIMKQIKDTLPNYSFNLSAVFYRDTLDEYLTKIHDFESDVDKIQKFIAANEAAGGGDFPEAVHNGLNVALNQLSWRNDAITKIVFIILDAPPHQRDDVILELQSLIYKASEMGIRIVPVACSGIDKSTEYILRSMALLTNGTYTFLTDDSGIGNPHIKPSTDKFNVETLKDLLIRVVYQYSYFPACKYEKDDLVQDTSTVRYPVTGVDSLGSQAESFEISIFPNPTFGVVTLEFEGNPMELFLADISGKIIERLDTKGQDSISVDLTRLPAGVYLIMYEYSPGKWVKGKIVLIH